MKKVIVLIFLMLPSIIFAQDSSMGVWGNVIKSEAGSRLELVARKDNRGGYELDITHRYPNSLGESLFLAVNIPSYQIEGFKSQLKHVKSKYDEWYKTAKANKVDYLEKTIPVSLNAYGDMFGTKLSYPENKDMEAVFFVSNYVIHCIIKVSISGYNTYQLSEWILTSTDISKIVTEIDRTIQHQRNYDNQQRQTQDLFK
ncbi:MAG: hypothetical protein KA955_09375 [Prevotella sp.]|nr:hypothetical protein [Prevotella sp.]